MSLSFLSSLTLFSRRSLSFQSNAFLSSLSLLFSLCDGDGDGDECGGDGDGDDDADGGDDDDDDEDDGEIVLLANVLSNATAARDRMARGAAG